jgi:hypothetical protein
MVNGRTAQAGVKRRVNDLMRDGLRRDETERIAFFCECVRADCYQAVWLNGDEYDRARDDPEWAAMIDAHRVEVAAA